MTKYKRAARPERDRVVFQVLRSIRGISNADVARASGISAQTVAKWRAPIASGGTRFPQFWTLNRVAKAHGLEFKLLPVDDRREGRDNELRTH